METITRRSLAPLMAAGLAPRPDWRPPNIVIIFADDLGYGDLGCQGHPTIRTPHLDQMAREGVRFTQFYDAAPACSPSRAALLTGRLPVRNGVNNVLNPWAQGGLPAEETTLAEALKPRGYATACVGKWHLGHRPQYLPTRRGFDSWFGIPYSNDMSKATAGNPGFIRSLEQHPETGPLPLMRGERIVETEPDQSQLTRRYTEEATRFIRESANRPFFLYLPHAMPHHPLAASERFRGKSRRGLYGDVVEELDWSVGEIRRTLRERKLDTNTLLVFSSDNGPWLVKNEEGGSAGLLREGKGTHWEGGFRVPAIAAWPGRIPAGLTAMAPASTMDLFPTVLAQAGAEAPAGRMLDGQDISPLLFGRVSTREDFALFYYGGQVLRGVRAGPWKLVLPARAVEKPALYHLEHDPSEKYDRAGAEPGVVERLQAIIAEHRRTLVPGPPQS
ncbi:MAG: sulfatase [Candidatus Solibacter usitatus]|nr:sulfatase [Candidatus Solibacter usitatus]